MRDVFRRGLLAALFLMMWWAGTANADKCTAAKLKATGKRVSSLLSCQPTVVKKNTTAKLAECQTKAITKFSAAFAKAGSCIGTEGTCVAATDNCITASTSAMSDTLPSKCEAAKLKAAGKL